MSDPTEYEPGYSFSGFQASSPSAPLPATKLDDELANIGEAIDDHAAAIKDVRRSDGALKNNIVTYDSLSKSLQITFDPTNGEAVADAVAVAQAAAAASSSSATSSATSATNAANSAASAAASASGVNLALYLSKAGNLAGIGNVDTARGNISAMKTDGSDAIGRLAPNGDYSVTDFNNCVANGFYSGLSTAANGPDSVNSWLVQVLTPDPLQRWVTQIAYQFGGANTSADSVLVYRRHSYDSGGVRTWTPWISNSAVPVGTIASFATASAPPGYLKLNGALLSRAIYAALWNHANNSGNLVSEATWSGGSSGAFSTGDLSTTFRLPDTRGEFMRWYDDGRGVDSGRVLGARQADSLKDHTHTYVQPTFASTTPGGSFTGVSAGSITGATSSPSTGAASETRPRNIALLACIKF